MKFRTTHWIQSIPYSFCLKPCKRASCSHDITRKLSTNALGFKVATFIAIGIGSQSNQPRRKGLFVSLVRDMSIVNWVMDLTINIGVTTLIAYRLWSMGRSVAMLSASSNSTQSLQTRARSNKYFGIMMYVLVVLLSFNSLGLRLTIYPSWKDDGWIWAVVLNGDPSHSVHLSQWIPCNHHCYRQFGSTCGKSDTFRFIGKEIWPTDLDHHSVAHHVSIHSVNTDYRETTHVTYIYSVRVGLGLTHSHPARSTAGRSTSTKLEFAGVHVNMAQSQDIDHSTNLEMSNVDVTIGEERHKIAETFGP